MVAIISVGDISGLLVRRSRRGERQRVSVAWRQGMWQGGRSQLALLVDDEGTVKWLGRALAKIKVTDTDRRIEVGDVEEFAGILLSDLRKLVPEQFSGSLRVGILAKAAGEVTVAALVRQFPGLAATVERLSKGDGFEIPQGVRGQVLNEQRDSLGLILDFEGIGREALRDRKSVV